MNVRPELHGTFVSHEAAQEIHSECGKPIVAVIGAGPCGVRVAQELSGLGCPVIIFNAEKRAAHNRIQLTSLLTGDAQIGIVTRPAVFNGPGVVKYYSDNAIVDIDREEHTITSRYGRKWKYDKLVLCMGSRPHIPAIPGITLSGVYRFRNFDDVEQLYARTFRARDVVVVGGGLLGLEAARGMAWRGAKTTVIEHTSHLMARQIDLAGGDFLAAKIEEIGLTVRTGKAISRIEGTHRVEKVILSDGEEIFCDTVIVCTGIRANIELARDAGLAVQRGIVVTKTLQTSDPDIYAIGECAEYDGQIYGLVGPGFEQASVAAAQICGGGKVYTGSVPATKLKLLGIDVFSMGDVDQIDQRYDVQTLSYRDHSKGLYRRLVFHRGRLTGALAVGDWPGIGEIQRRIHMRARAPFWQRARFRISGRLTAETEAGSVASWPAEATVCNCTGVTRGQLTQAMALGCKSVEALGQSTSASTVCGSCRPFLQDLLGASVTREPPALSRPLKAGSIAALLMVLLGLTFPPVPFASTIMNTGWPEFLWLESLPKQISGYTLLAVFAFAALLPLRKRVPWFALGKYINWRVVHVFLGAAALFVFFAHTGLRLGANLNGLLAWSFLGLALAGAFAGLSIALEYRIGSTAAFAQSVRNANYWLHLLLLWPIPVLLTFHILTFYYY